MTEKSTEQMKKFSKLVESKLTKVNEAPVDFFDADDFIDEQVGDLETVTWPNVETRVKELLIRMQQQYLANIRSTAKADSAAQDDIEEIITELGLQFNLLCVKNMHISLDD